VNPRNLLHFKLILIVVLILALSGCAGKEVIGLAILGEKMAGKKSHSRG